MENLTARQEKILAAIVKEYSQAGRPAASEELEEKYDFAVSSATIRNEMKALEKAGFISQPHTSAGRVPTDQGYRYFVNRLMKHLELSGEQQRRLSQELKKLQQQYMELGQGLAKLLAEETHGAAFALMPQSESGGRRQVSAAGLPNVIDDLSTQKEIKELASFLDELSEYGKVITKTCKDDVEAFIGKENPVPSRLSDFSLLVSHVRLPDGGRGVIGVIGPKRMKYAKNISLLEYVGKLLSGGLVVLFFVNFKF